MAADEKWYFTKTQLANTPSKKCGLDADKELSYRQQAANFIQDMGQRLKVTQLCINTAIVYMHRFYIFHSFTQFHRNSMALASLFLAAKVEEQPRKLEHVITVSHWCLKKEEPKLDTKSEQYLEQAQELVFNENVLLQTLGFDVAIDHPHTHVVRCCHLVRANKELAQTSYFMASNSLHLTTMCLQYKPTVVACFCIHLACKWSSWEIPQSSEGKDWFTYIDPSVSLEQLEQLTAEFLAIYEKCPSRLKKMSGKKDDSFALMGHNMSGPQMEQEPRKIRPTFPSVRPIGPQDGATGSSSLSGRPEDSKKPLPSRVDYRDYKEKKAREAAAAAAGTSSKDVKHPPSQQSRPPAPPNHHLAKREAAKREMMARDSAAAKREALKQEGGRMPRPVDVSNQHHVSQDSRDQKRPRDVLDNVAGSISQTQLHADSLIQQKSHHSSLDMSNRRSREPSDLPSHHHHHHHGHHHGDNVRRDVQRPSPTPSSNHHSSTHVSNSMKRPRDSHDLATLGQPISQPKRPREGADPTANILDPSKRPREPTDSNHSFGSAKSDSSAQSSSSENSQQGDRYHQTTTSMKYLQDSKPPSAFGDRPSSKGLPPTNSSNMPSRLFNHRHSRPQDGAAKNYETDQQMRSKLPLDKRDAPLVQKPQDPHSLRPSQQPMVGISPTLALSRPKSPSDYLNKPSESHSRSPKHVSSDVYKRTADILSRPSGHLFSPEDDREDCSLPSLESDSQFQSLLMDAAQTSHADSGYRSRELTPAEPVFIKSEKPSPTMKSKLRSTPEKSRDNSLASHMFALPSSPSNQALQGKAGLPTTPTTPTSENRKRRRTQSSSSSEPELVPLIRKLEDIPGFHGLIKDKEVGIKLPGRVPDMIQPIRDHSLPSTPGKDTPLSSSFIKQEVPTNGSMKHEALGNDLKSLSDSSSKDMKQYVPTLVEPFKVKQEVIESRTIELETHLPPLLPNLTDVPPTPGSEKNVEPIRTTEESIPTGSGEHHRKKKKEKHGKKDKDKDRNREERKHKHKKKEKEKDRNREEKSNANAGSAPIKITITKDKLANVSQDSKRSPLTQDGTSGLKIKIPKERLKVESSQLASSTSTSSSMSMGGLKIKIGKELISERRLESTPEQNSRKRSTNESSSSSSKTPGTQQPSRRNYKQNGHPDKKVRGGFIRGRGSRAHPGPRHPPPYHQQYYPYIPPMYMYPPEAQHMYGFYPPQHPAPMYQTNFPTPPPPLPTARFQNPQPPPLPIGPPPDVPPPPPE